MIYYNIQVFLLYSRVGLKSTITNYNIKFMGMNEIPTTTTTTTKNEAIDFD